MDATLEDVEFLVCSSHRIEVLDALSESARDRNDLRSVTGASSPTLSRILADFEDRNWVERRGKAYRLTDLGAFVADRLAGFLDEMTVERRLRDVWPWLPHQLEGFSVESFTDVTVTHPNPGYPDALVERRMELIAETSTWRGFGMAMLGLRTLELSFDRFLDDRDEFRCEYIYPPEVFEELLSWGDAGTILEAAETDCYTVLLHEELPVDDRFEVSLFDDRVTICCYDRETGALRALVETTSAEMRTWAEAYYERFRAQARPLGDALEDGTFRSVRETGSS